MFRQSQTISSNLISQSDPGWSLRLLCKLLQCGVWQQFQLCLCRHGVQTLQLCSCCHKANHGTHVSGAIMSVVASSWVIILIFPSQMVLQWSFEYWLWWGNNSEVSVASEILSEFLPVLWMRKVFMFVVTECGSGENFTFSTPVSVVACS